MSELSKQVERLETTFRCFMNGASAASCFKQLDYVPDPAPPDDAAFEAFKAWKASINRGMKFDDALWLAWQAALASRGSYDEGVEAAADVCWQSSITTPSQTELRHGLKAEILALKRSKPEAAGDRSYNAEFQAWRLKTYTQEGCNNQTIGFVHGLWAAWQAAYNAGHANGEKSGRGKGIEEAAEYVTAKKLAGLVAGGGDIRKLAKQEPDDEV